MDFGKAFDLVDHNILFTKLWKYNTYLIFSCFYVLLTVCVVVFFSVTFYRSVQLPLRTDNHAITPPLSFFTGRMPFPTPKHWRQKEPTVTLDKDSAAQTICRISTIVVGNCVQVLHRFHASIRWHVGSLACWCALPRASCQTCSLESRLSFHWRTIRSCCWPRPSGMTRRHTQQ